MEKNRSNYFFELKLGSGVVIIAAVFCLLVIYVFGSFRLIEQLGLEGLWASFVFSMMLKAIVYTCFSILIYSPVPSRTFRSGLIQYALVYTFDMVIFRSVHFFITNRISNLSNELFDLSPTGLALFFAYYAFYFLVFLLFYYLGYRLAGKNHQNTGVCS